MRLPSRSSLRVAVLLVPMLGALADVAASEPPLPGEYRVQDGRVDRGTWLGWRLFHSACHGCHGIGGVGSEVAPGLVERVRGMTPREFTTKVLTSYRLVAPAAGGSDEDRARERLATVEDILRRQRGSGSSRVVMPGWASDDQVPTHVLDLYAYLSARADGKLGPQQPQPIDSKPPRR
jgi:mono/diheme cytochrome c family protein